MRRFLFIFSLIVFPFLVVYSMEGGKYYFSHISLEDGLSQLSVLKIIQDSKGYMWFGTRNGLNKYDGNKIVVYKHHSGDPMSLISDHITALVEDKDHCLWIGTSHGLSKLDLKTDKMISYSKKEFSLLEGGVSVLFIDSCERLWIGNASGLSLYDKNTNNFEIIHLDGNLEKVNITAIYETVDHYLLIGTETKGVYICDLALNILHHYAKSSGNKKLPDDYVSAIHEDSHGQLWLGTNNSGMLRIDMNNEKVFSFTTENSKLSTNSIRCFAEMENTLFVGTFDGLYTIDLTTNTLAIHSKAEKGKGYLSHFSIYSIFVDNNNSIWVGTYAGGVNYYSKYNNRFVFHEPTNVFNVLLGIYGGMVCKEPDQLYVATEGSGLLGYNLSTNTYNYYLYDVSNLQHSYNIIKSVMLEGDIIWCGTNQGTIYQFDTKTKKFSLSFSLTTNNTSIYSILRASDNALWVVTSKPSLGLIKFTDDKRKESFTSYDEEEGEMWFPGSSRCLLELREGMYLIGTRSNGLYKYDEKQNIKVIYHVDGTDNFKLPSNYVTSILRTSSGQFWIGTFGGGLCLYDEEKGIVKTITKQQGLINNDVCAVVEDKNGNIWVSTNNCISKYNPNTDEINNFDQTMRNVTQEFTPHSGMLLPNGEICFSTSNGFVTFKPEHIQKNSFLPPVVFTNLTINNKPVSPSIEDDILKCVLDDTDKIELNHNQNNIVIGYCALNYVYANQNQYAYRLKGHDKEWNYVKNRKEAYYTNLNPGKYIFEVKASNNDGLWSDKIKTLSILIHPPLWKTWFAYIFYTILFFGISFLILYNIIRKKKLEQALLYKQLEQQRSEEFHQTKIRMFTNFAHELRTPLTLIIPPLQELLQYADFNSNVKNKLNLIFKNSQRLFLLVNQLMDLRKNQSGKMQLKITKDDICYFIMEIYYAFNQIAMNKKIILIFDHTEEEILAWFDKSLFEKVVFNLLSNAIKYTNEGGTVTISVQRIPFDRIPQKRKEELKKTDSEHEWICLSVSDTGKGIPENEMENIFAPFYQHDSSKEIVGTGIGLSLTQSIVQLHRGTIWVENSDTKGAIFTVILPISKEIYSDDEFDKEDENSIEKDVLPFENSWEKPDLEKKYTLLLVEDNEDVRNYIREYLESYFFVLTADNGEDAFDIVLDKYPDIVVSDIMMPRKDGLELCMQIKEDLRVGHIPVILITAKSMVMHIKDGFLVGADDYMVKPFSLDILIYRIKNIMESRERLKKLYGKKFSPDAIGIQTVSGDDQFTQKLFLIIEKNISNLDLNIDTICRDIGMSRTNLYRKLKAITELSPIDLIRNKRLEVGSRLLLETDLPVSEISLHVGFNSHAYFTQCFKALYGVSPTEFLMKHKKTSKRVDFTNF